VSRVRNAVGVLWLRLRYRLRGARYGHTALTDPANVQFVLVEREYEQ